MRPRLPQSLSLRLTLLFLLLAGLLGVVILAGIRQAVVNDFRTTLLPHVEHYLDGLAAEIGTPPSIDRATALAAQLPLRIRIEGPRVNWSSDARDGPRHPLPQWAEELHTRRLADGHRILFYLARPERQRPSPTVLLTLAAAALAVAFIFWRVRRLFRPIEEIRQGVARFGRGELEHRIPQQRDDELGDLAGRINGMAGEIGRMLEAKRQLLLAIGHELRSPLTRARLHTELLDDSAERAALLRDLGAMRDLIDDLLEGERLKGGHAALHLEPTNPRGLIADLLAARFPDAPIQVEVEEPLPTIPLDTSRIRLLLRNLLDNALRHNDAAVGGVQLRVSATAEWLRLEVRDHGPGVTESQLAHLAEPFYRPDSARGRESGGVGLGLYLCRLIAEAHGGSLRIDNAAPGLRVWVQLGR